MRKYNSKRTREDGFHLYLAINKMTFKIKELFKPSRNRSVTLDRLDALKHILYRRSENVDKSLEKAMIEPDSNNSRIKELEKSLDTFEQRIDLIDLENLTGKDNLIDLEKVADENN